MKKNREAKVLLMFLELGIMLALFVYAFEYLPLIVAIAFTIVALIIVFLFSMRIWRVLS
jgi:hypothetical protein